MSVATTDLARACATAALGAGERPAGWAIAGRRFLLLEVPLPWPAAIETAVGLPPGMADLLASIVDDQDPSVLAIAPDPDLSTAGRTRLILFDPPTDPEPTYLRSEHHVATSDVAELVRAWLPGGPTAIQGSTGAGPVIRDIVVCTHGSHDSCCGRLGAPLYREVRDRWATTSLRVWRGSHTGGHRFAPTLLDLPGGRSWARILPAHLPGVLGRAGHPDALRGRYRGLALLPTFYGRLAEAELLHRVGWELADRAVTAELIEGHPFRFPEDPDELDDRACVRLTVHDGGASGPPQTWEARIERGDDVLTRGECGEEPWLSPSYAVTDLRPMASQPPSTA